MKLIILSILFLLGALSGCLSQNRDPLKIEIVTSDIRNFWIAFESSKPDFKAESFQKLYIEKGTKGVRGFMKNRIQSAEYLSKVVKKYSAYYSSIQISTESIASMEDEIKNTMVNMKKIYSNAVFPPVYFVIGTLNSGGTTGGGGLIIGAEMYGLSSETPTDNLGEWLKTVLKPVEDIPHIVAHELVHFQQKYDGGSLLEASIKEGAADFIAELISGKHINSHVHDFANPKEKELWYEFKARMLKKDYTGWLYSATEGRPNDLGYWMGYQITKSYYDNSPDKIKAIDDIMHIRDFEEFLQQSKYPDKFN
jgi:hypothetical protein